ncbi:MAG TPA: hypothetical protein VK466_08885, partial [Terriglobales bacterium]|nr:hypothetical protein [Terriglobales bacterium]
LRRWLPGGATADREKNPALFWALEKLSQELGGPPESHIRLAMAIWAMLHGTASLLISGAVDPRLDPEMCAGCETAVRLLIREAGTRAPRKSPERD